LKAFAITKKKKFIWKGRDVDDLEIEMLLTEADFVFCFLYRSDIDSGEKDADGKLVPQAREEEMMKYVDEY
jgi:hypothetical protein